MIALATFVLGLIVGGVIVWTVELLLRSPDVHLAVMKAADEARRRRAERDEERR